MPTRIDCEYEVLKAAGYPGTISEKELAWLKANGAVSGNVMDAWNEFLTAQGQPTPGTLIDRRRNWLLGLIGVDPAIGEAWIDLWKAFWCQFGGDINGDISNAAMSKDPFFTTPIDSVWTPIVPAHAVYTNDFSGTGGNDLTGWTSGYSGAITTQATVSGGTLNAATRQVELCAPGEYTDCDVSASVLKSCLGISATFGLRARFNSTGDNLGFYLNGTTGAVSVYDFIGGIWTELGGQSAQQPIPGPLVAVRLKVIGSTFEVYIDGVLTNSGTTSVSGAGKTGIRAGEIGATLEDYSSTSLDPFYFYDTADFTVYVTDVGLSQTGAKALPTGTAGTFHIRLREAKTTDTIVTIRNGATLLGNATIPAGQVYRQVRYILAAPVSKDFSFVLMSPVTGTGYANDFSGTGGNDLTGWKVDPSSGPVGVPAPVAGEVALQNGNLVFGTASRFLLYSPMADTTDVEVSAAVDNTVYPAGLMARATQGAAVLLWLRSDGTNSLLEWVSGAWQTIGGGPTVGLSTSTALRLVVKGSQVQGFVNGVVVVTATTSVVGPGRVGFRADGGVPNALIASDFRASSGGVAFESFAAGVTAADGGIPQSVDPYFNAAAGAPWAVGTSAFGGNTATFGASGNWLIQDLTGIALPGETWEYRYYLVKPDPAVPMTFRMGGTPVGDMQDGWHAGSVVMGANPNLQINGGQTGSPAPVLHFLFAWPATPVVLFTP